MHEGTSLHAVTFMLKEVDLPVMLIVDRVVQHSPFQFHAFGYTHLSVPIARMHYLTRSKFNYLLTEMIIPQTYNTYKTTFCLLCIQNSLRLAPNYVCKLYMSICCIDYD